MRISAKLLFLFIFYSNVFLAAEFSEPLNWQYDVDFDVPNFLNRCREDPVCSRFQIRDTDSDHTKAWFILFALRDHYLSPTADRALLAHTYHAMARLVLSSDMPPVQTMGMDHISFSQYRAHHISTLIDILGPYSTRPELKNKVAKWSHIYLALLFREWAVKYSSQKNEFLRRAYEAISKATALKTTRVTHLIAAQLIKEDGYTPAGMSHEAALRLANEHIRLAFASEARGTRASNAVRHPNHWLIQHARPPYIRDIQPRVRVQREVLVQPETFVQPETSVQPEVPVQPEAPAPIVVENDPLAAFNLAGLTIGQGNFQTLPFRVDLLNAINRRVVFPHLIDGERYYRQNVSARGNNCFFNAMGLGREQAVEQLRAASNDPEIRAMVANEILSMARNAREFTPELREATDFSTWERTIAEIQEQQTIPGADGALLLLRMQDNDDQLRERGFRLPAFHAFINRLGQSGIMAGTISDVLGNGIGNFTAIDAIAKAYNIAIRIFRPNGGLLHQYTPENAIERRYLYFEDLHFQALLPENQQNNDIAISMPSNADLASMYPTSKSAPYRNIDDNTVRKMLYLSDEHEFTQVEIGEYLNLDPRRVSEVLTANDRKTRRKFSEHVKTLMQESFLVDWEDVRNGSLAKTASAQKIISALPEEHQLSQKQIVNYWNELLRPRHAETTEQQRLDIVNAYRSETTSIIDIARRYSLNIREVLKTLSEDLEAHEFRNPLGIEKFEKDSDKSALEQSVIATFENLRDQNIASPPLVSQVAAILKIRYKTVYNILINNHLTSRRKIAEHLDRTVRHQIIEAYKVASPGMGERVKCYEELGRKFNATIVQVKGIILKYEKDGDDYSGDTTKKQPRDDSGSDRDTNKRSRK